LIGDDNPHVLSPAPANTPLTTFVTPADELLDNRNGLLAKPVRLLTGLRVTDMDTEEQRAIETWNALKEILRGQPNLSKYTSFYVKPEQAENLTPQEIELTRFYSTIQDNAKNYSHQQRIGVRQ
jgi:hypothetical protein